MLEYFKKVRAELKHVSWPSQRQTIVYTVIVVAVSFGVAIYLGLLDYLFEAVLFRII